VKGRRGEGAISERRNHRSRKKGGGAISRRRKNRGSGVMRATTRPTRQERGVATLGGVKTRGKKDRTRGPPMGNCGSFSPGWKFFSLKEHKGGGQKRRKQGEKPKRKLTTTVQKRKKKKPESPTKQKIFTAPRCESQGKKKAGRGGGKH